MKQDRRKRSVHDRLSKNKITPTRWKSILHDTANGLTRQVVCNRAQVTPQTLNAYLIANEGKTEELRAAQLTWYRRDWPMERIEEMLTLIALGRTNKKAAEELQLLPGELEQFMRIMLRDPELKVIYDEAREMQAESWSDEMVDIANDGRNDTYVDDKGNVRVDHDVVNRSKLRVNTMQWLMGRIHHKRFGDKLHQTVDGNLNVNHTEILDNARRRKEQVAQQRRERAQEERPEQHQVH